MTYDTWWGESRIRLENETLRAVILPRMGGRVISLFHKGNGFEAAAEKAGETYAVIAAGGSTAYANVMRRKRAVTKTQAIKRLDFRNQAV